MPRFTPVTFIALAAWLPWPGQAQALPPDLLTADAAVSLGGQPDRRPLQRLAEEALAAGLSTTAAGLFAQLLADPALTGAERESAGLGLTTAYLERTRTAEAKAALRFLPKSPRKTLREGLVALLENDAVGAKAMAGELVLADLPAHEIAWGHALRWMVAAAEDDYLTINLSQEAITRSAVSAEQRQRIEVLGYRAMVIAGKVEERTLAALNELATKARGSPLAFAYARNLALARARLGDAKGAVQALREAGPLPPPRQAESDLLAGLILGAHSPAGRARLKEAARNPSNVSARLTALRALVSAAAPPVGDAPPEPDADPKSIANEVNDFLLRRDPVRDDYFCPRDPAVLDSIHLARAQLMLFAGSREKARQAAEDLLKEVPASPLAKEAVRTLAIAAWGDGSFRLAATHLSALAESSVEPERAQLRIAAADCLFLAKDFAFAEKAYATLQKDAADIRVGEAAFHQRILCLLEISEDTAAWNRTAEVIEETARTNRTRTRVPIWSAVWSLGEDIRRRGRAEEASRLLARLAPLTAQARLDYALRLDWQKALLAIANDQPGQAALIAEDIGRRLAAIPEDEDLEALRRSAPELRAHAALLKARSALGAGSASGFAELVALRERYGKVPAAAAAFLIEGRHLAGLKQHAEAQACFERLAREFQREPGLEEFAALGLYEAAEQAVVRSVAGGESRLLEAAELLERFSADYPLNHLIPRVALRRAEILRLLAQFDKALLVLDNLIRDRPADASRAQAEMARADTLFGLAQFRRDRAGQPDRQRISRAADEYERIANTRTKDSPDFQIEACYKWALTLTEKARAEPATEAGATRAAARKALLRPLTVLRATIQADGAGVADRSSEGRLWLARAILLLGELCEAEGDRAEAIAAYTLIVTVNQGLVGGQVRLPGQAAAESKLAALRQSSSSPR